MTQILHISKIILVVSRNLTRNSAITRTNLFLHPFNLPCMSDSNNSLLPDRNEFSYNFRHERTFNIPMTHTNRVENSFIYALCTKVNNS